ncbi:MAG: endo-1,4-beta-xylanase [Lachnospiraceae bacterium]|nr:endo-1,4-beta-xylanase [Lachnospiraceae bacterium]
MRKLRYMFVVLTLGTVLFAACGEKPGNAPVPTEAPQETEAPEETPEPTAKPTATPKPTPTPMGSNLPKGINLKNTYGETFGHIGTCINGRQFSDPAALALIKENYNSITMENEMKPDAILGNSATLISVDEAKALGYVIPENYKESTVPQLNFYYTDRAIQFCVDNNMGLRGHTLVWHSQTPSWFFREGYKRDGAFVAPEVMDARLEFFIRSVMGHVYDNENGSVLYSWDVVNEYVHANNAGWKEVYGEEGLSAGFVKKAFVIADDVLRQYGNREEVSLLYNDFNTYSETLQILNLLEFVNADGKVCDGVGMQSHLTVDNPHVIKFTTAMKKFLEAGHEVHITELDVGNTNDLYQAKYCYDLMTKILELKKEGAAINGITWWGLADTNSWRPGEKALMYKTLKTPKLSYYRVMEAYVDAGLYMEEQ